MSDNLRVIDGGAMLAQHTKKRKYGDTRSEIVAFKDLPVDEVEGYDEDDAQTFYSLGGCTSPKPSRDIPVGRRPVLMVQHRPVLRKELRSPLENPLSPSIQRLSPCSSSSADTGEYKRANRDNEKPSALQKQPSSEGSSSNPRKRPCTVTRRDFQEQVIGLEIDAGVVDYEKGVQEEPIKDDREDIMPDPVPSSSPAPASSYVADFDYPINTAVRKHFPGEGWYNGKVTDMHIQQGSSKLYKVEYEGDDDGDKEAEMLKESELNGIVLPPGRHIDPSVYPSDDFYDMWEKLDPESVEKSTAVRRANTRISNEESGTQNTAQYGRILPQATDILFDVLKLKRSDIFLDIGHGVGNACLQAAYCVGCESRGIEIIKDRYGVSLEFQAQIETMACELQQTKGTSRVAGNVVLKRGDLSDGALHNWLVSANKVFVNNFGGVFSHRCENQGGSQYHLDHYIAGLFASMEEEAILITLSDLQMGPTRKEANNWRIANKMESSENASFFDVVKVELGESSQVFSWCQSSAKPAIAYVYRRLKQAAHLRSSTFFCCNRDCEHSSLGTPIQAVSINNEGKAVVGHCQCKMLSCRSRRDIPTVTFQEFLKKDGDYSEWGR